jgi:ABC-type transporter Mla MlaB component
MEPSIVVFVIDGPIDRVDIPAMCDRFRELLQRARPDRVMCDVTALIAPDAIVVDALARLQLTARRLGLQMFLSDAPVELEELLSLMGLRDVLGFNRPSAVEARGQPEHREERLRVQEERDSGKPAV